LALLQRQPPETRIVDECEDANGLDELDTFADMIDEVEMSLRVKLVPPMIALNSVDADDLRLFE
jgi:hypothetical protein